MYVYLSAEFANALYNPIAYQSELEKRAKQLSVLEDDTNIDQVCFSYICVCNILMRNAVSALCHKTSISYRRSSVTKLAANYDSRAVSPRITKLYTELIEYWVTVRQTVQPTKSNNSASVSRMITTNDTQNVCSDLRVEWCGVLPGTTNWWASC